MADPDTRPNPSLPLPGETSAQIRARRRYVEKELEFFKHLSKVAITIGTFGGSITFSLIITDIRQPRVMTEATVQALLAVSWLLFILAIGFASLTVSLLDWFGGQIKREFQTDNGQQKWLWYDAAFSVTLGLSLLGAFLFASIVVMAYVMPVGIIGIVFIGFVGIVWAIMYRLSSLSLNEEQLD